jgi:hypothetical protein
LKKDKITEKVRKRVAGAGLRIGLVRLGYPLNNDSMDLPYKSLSLANFEILKKNCTFEEMKIFSRWKHLK